MDALLKVLRGELLRVVGEIDAGNSYLDEESAMGIISAIKQYSHTDEYCTKYAACEKLGVKRATFDNLVAAGKLPKGQKLYAGDNTLFWKVTDLIDYTKNKTKRS